MQFYKLYVIMQRLKKKFPSLQSLGTDGNTCFLRAARAGNLEKVLEHLKNNNNINTSNANGLNALHLASKDGHIHVVYELIRRGAVVDSATNKGNTALHIASLAGQEEVVKMLLEHGASVNVQSQNGFTPLYMAAQENHDSVVKLLLAKGANQTLATEDGFTPLAVAMQQGHDKVVAVLLESDTRGKVRLPALHMAAKKDDVKAATLLLDNDHNPDVTSKSGFTPLHIACHYGNQGVANLLIQKGADINYTAKHNINPLHVAAKWGKANMVSLLLEKGAIIEAKTRDGLTPLHCAARSGHEQVVDILLERGAPISAKTKNGLAPLHMAAQGEHVDAARILLYHRAPVDEVTVDYLTALHVAAHCGHVRVAKLLLDRNADANARALNGFTPLHIACKKNRIKVVELLLRHGASISATTESGLTPLHVAAFMGCMNIVIYLLQHDANPDVPTVRGETPLHLAARANQTDIIRILLRNGAQVDARAREKQTPLHIASRLGNVDIVMLLLQHSAQVDATTKDMYTALHIAAKEGQDEVAAVLVENGAAVDACTKKGFTPLHLAAKYGHSNVAQLLLQKAAPVDAKGKNGVTPLHVACHYNHQNVALLLLENGASARATAKNGHSTLHIVARKNQMDIATTLLEYGAQTNAESKAGFTPLHLACQGGHTEMCTLFIEHKANVNHPAKNGLTPMHLCAQEDSVQCAEILYRNDANIDMVTKAGYTPLHVAAHFGQANMVRFLLQKMANVDAATSIGYTPLHQTAQQGHSHIVNLLLEHKANVNAQTVNGQTPLHIARKLGYISVLESLKSITNKDDEYTPLNDEKYRVVAPEAMQESFMSDSEEEGGEENLLSDQPYHYLTVDEMKSLGDDSLPIDVTRDERADSNRFAQNAEYGIQHLDQLSSLGTENLRPEKVQVHGGGKDNYDSVYMDDSLHEKQKFMGRKLIWKSFLVSFLVDARGGAMRGCRHNGIRVIIPARSICQPTRVTCRYVKPQRTMHPPQLMEGEALASRVLEVGPVSTQFMGPVIMEVPHFASIRGKEREIIILRSDNGEFWREHIIENSEEILQNVLQQCFEREEIAQISEQSGNRVCRFVTYDFPQYFAIVSRIRQEVHAIGPEGGMVSSTVVPQVQAVFPQGALTKKIKIGLQAQLVDSDLTAKLLGRGVAVSPIVTVEPRRRKFHKAITLSMPAPKAHSQGMVNQYSSGNTPTLRLLCSITGGPSRAQWEDVTGSTPLTFVNDCVSFTTTVSARFWLMDCRNISDASRMATELYKDVIHVPFLAKFVVFAKTVDMNEARLRVFCMTDDREMKTLEKQELYTEVAKSRDVEVLESKSQYVEMAGNLLPVTKSGEQLKLNFKAFRENRLSFTVRVKDQHADKVGRTLFMKEPKVAKGEPPQQPICILNIVLPENIVADSATSFSEKLTVNGSNFEKPAVKHLNDYYIGDMRIADLSNLLGRDWIKLAPEIGFNTDEINHIVSQFPDSIARQAHHMIQLYRGKQNYSSQALQSVLPKINREDIIKRCRTVISSENDISKAPDLNEKLIRVHQESQHIRNSNEQNEIKYSAEEKAVGESESDDDTAKRTVAERREKIVKRLSVEREIPASAQKKEIAREIVEIKRKSLIEDKKAIHESEILMQLPVDNILKPPTAPDQKLKIKSTTNADTFKITKVVLELNDKINKRNSEENEALSEDRTSEAKSSSHDDSEKIHEPFIANENNFLKQSKTLMGDLQKNEMQFENNSMLQRVDLRFDHHDHLIMEQNEVSSNRNIMKFIENEIHQIEASNERQYTPNIEEVLEQRDLDKVESKQAEEILSPIEFKENKQYNITEEEYLKTIEETQLKMDEKTNKTETQILKTESIISQINELENQLINRDEVEYCLRKSETDNVSKEIAEKPMEIGQIHKNGKLKLSIQVHDKLPVSTKDCAAVMQAATQLLDDTEQSIERFFEKNYENEYEHDHKLPNDMQSLKSTDGTCDKENIDKDINEIQNFDKLPSLETSSEGYSEKEHLEKSVSVAKMECEKTDVPDEQHQKSIPDFEKPDRDINAANLVDMNAITEDTNTYDMPQMFHHTIDSVNEKAVLKTAKDLTIELDLSATSFYIGESSQNVIVKTTPNKQSCKSIEETNVNKKEESSESIEEHENEQETRQGKLELDQALATVKEQQSDHEQMQKSEWEISEQNINEVNLAAVSQSSVFTTEGELKDDEFQKEELAISPDSITVESLKTDHNISLISAEGKSEPIESFSSTEIGDKTNLDYTKQTLLDEHKYKRNSSIKQEATAFQLPAQLSLIDYEVSTSSETPYKSLEKHESLIYTQPNSSEYVTAMDGSSTFREDTEYISAASTFDSRGQLTSSHDSICSLDSQSEISGHLNTISISQITDTLVASSEAEPVEDINLDCELSQDGKYIDNTDGTTESDPEFFLQDGQPEETHMKRSKEMIFKDLSEKQSEDETHDLPADEMYLQMETQEKIMTQSPIYETEVKKDEINLLFPDSVEICQSSSYISMEKVKIDPSLEESSILSTSFTYSDPVEPHRTIDEIKMASNLDDGSILSCSFSSTADVETVIENVEGINVQSSTELAQIDKCNNQRKGETFDLEKQKDLEAIGEQIVTGASNEKVFEGQLLPGSAENKESESESDTDPYESEYVRQFRSPMERKSRRKQQTSTDIDYILEFEKRPFTPSEFVAEIIVEDEDTEKLEEQAVLQHELKSPQQQFKSYANIPDITVTNEPQEKNEVSDTKATIVHQEQSLYKVKTQKELNKVIDEAVEEEKMQKLVEEQYRQKLAQIVDLDINNERQKSDSQDSFEVIEQPDISDEFVIVEEVAREANEVDLGGQTIEIQAAKMEKKHDEEVENIIIKSAPADPKLGSQIYGDDMNFEFEESPPTAGHGSEVQEGSDSKDSTMSKKRWIDMQMADNQMRYPYDIAGGVLEDIKEEDAEFEVGSSRISSYKDSFSSTPEYDNITSRRYATRSEHIDNASMSSLQEFESLEQAISLENRSKMCHGSTDSSSGSFPRKFIARHTTQGDDISVSSLKDFEGLENACFTAHLIEIKAKEEAALLSRSDESNKSADSEKDPGTDMKPSTRNNIVSSEFPTLAEKSTDVKETSEEVKTVADTSSDSIMETDRNPKAM